MENLKKNNQKTNPKPKNKPNILMRDPKRKVLLLVDNFSVHYLEKLEYSDLKIYFLPANTTSILQPCDAVS